MEILHPIIEDLESCVARLKALANMLEPTSVQDPVQQETPSVEAPAERPIDMEALPPKLRELAMKIGGAQTLCPSCGSCLTRDEAGNCEICNWPAQ